MTQPRPEWADDCCAVCPAQLLGPGEFDVVARPGHGLNYDPEAGYRVNAATGQAVCVHPFRVGLPPGEYASSGIPVTDPEAAPAPPGAPPGRRMRSLPAYVPSPDQLILPDSVDDLEGWLIAWVRSTAADATMASALSQAEAIALERFSGGEVVDALRRVLATELSG